MTVVPEPPAFPHYDGNPPLQHPDLEAKLVPKDRELVVDVSGDVFWFAPSIDEDSPT